MICGDNIEVLKTYPDNFFDSICTDAPYGLGEEPDPMEVMKDWVEKGYHEVKGSGGFMGKSWDAFVPQPLFWKEAFRVLKPGGHVLCFFGTRTYDWGVMAMRFAGFEIRDQIDYIYGVGFPKSLAIDKAIDKHLGVESKVVGQEKRAGKIAGTYGAFEGDNLIKEAVSFEAKQWTGWGSNLKPAHEPIVLARKPISEKTVASNVLKHHTGGINIDATRIGTEGARNNGSGMKSEIFGKYNPTEKVDYGKGRFPSNIILGCNCETEEHEEGCAVKEMDRQSGVSKSGNGAIRSSTTTIEQKFAGIKPQGLEVSYSDVGGASRFFYIAKPTEGEKEKGLRNFEYKDPASVTDFRPTLKSNPENWSNGTETPYTRTKQRKNIHPTIKPISLMQYLVRMITPPNGTCCDPFNGSGTTGIACKLEGFNYVGIEQNEYDCKISEARIAAWQSIKQEKLF